MGFGFVRGVLPERVYLRPAQEDDAAHLLAIYDPEVTRRFSFFEQPPTHSKERRYLRRMRESMCDELFAIICNLKGAGVVGTIGLHEIDERHANARLGILIWNREFHGKGIGTAAIRLLLDYAFFTRPRQLHSVYLTAFTDNISAQRLYRKMGFVSETILRGAYQLHDAAHDMLRMSIDKETWLTLL